MDRSLGVLYSKCQIEGIPLIIAGDIFHTWDNPAELLNFVIPRLKGMGSVYAIPGQHDLPNHNYEDAVKSSYWTLIEAGVIADMDPGFAYTFVNPDHGNFKTRLWPFPWGFVPEHPNKHGKDWNEGNPDLHVAVCHRYIWHDKDTSFPGAPEDRHVHSYSLAPYHAAIFGDNHLGFTLQYRLDAKRFGTMFNCGGFLRRNIDQKNYNVSYGVLMSDGRVVRQFVRHAHEDKWTEQSVLQSLKEITNATSPVARTEAIQQFIEEAGEMLFDFRDVVWKYVQTGALPAEVKRILEEVTGGKP